MLIKCQNLLNIIRLLACFYGLRLIKLLISTTNYQHVRFLLLQNLTIFNLPRVYNKIKKFTKQLYKNRLIFNFECLCIWTNAMWGRDFVDEVDALGVMAASAAGSDVETTRWRRLSVLVSTHARSSPAFSHPIPHALRLVLISISVSSIACRSLGFGRGSSMAYNVCVSTNWSMKISFYLVIRPWV